MVLPLLAYLLVVFSPANGQTPIFTHTPDTYSLIKETILDQHVCTKELDAVFNSQPRVCTQKPRGHEMPYGEHSAAHLEPPTFYEMPDAETFYRDFMRTSKPVVFRGAARNWPAMTLWKNLTYIKEKFGQDRFSVLFRFMYDKYHSLYSRTTMEDFIEVFKKEKVYMDSTVSFGMLNDFLWPKFLDCDKFMPMLKQLALFWNNAGSSSILHHDVTETFMAQVSGTRQWLVTKKTPEVSDDLYTEYFPFHSGMSPINTEKVDLLKYPNITKTETYNITVYEGDIIYVPEGWYHQVRTIGSPNIGMAIFINWLWCQNITAAETSTIYLEKCDAVREAWNKTIKCGNKARDDLSMTYIQDTYAHTNPRALGSMADTGGEAMEILEMRSGRHIPGLGYSPSECGNKSIANIRLALHTGYRFLETDIDDLQVSLGKTIKELGNIKRSDIFHLVKIHPRYLGYQATKNALSVALRNLNTEYIDLVLLQAPECDGDWFICDNLQLEGSWKDSWRALEEAVDQGKVHDLGAGHFNISLLDQMLQDSKVPPVVVQQRFDPTFLNEDVRMFCRQHNIIFMGHSITGERIMKDYDLAVNPLRHSKLMLFLTFKYRACPTAVALHWAWFSNNVLPTFKTCDPKEIQFNWYAPWVDTDDDRETINSVYYIKDLKHMDIVQDHEYYRKHGYSHFLHRHDAFL